MSGKDFVPFEEPPKKKEEQGPEYGYGGARRGVPESPEMRRYRQGQAPIPYTPQMLKSWVPAPGSAEVLKARRDDPSLKVGFVYDPDTGMAGLQRTGPLQVAAATSKLTPGMMGQQPEQQPKEGQKIAQWTPDATYLPGPPDIRQQTITRAPMQSMSELEVAAIQQHYGFENAAFAARLVRARHEMHNLYVAWYQEAQRSGDKVGAARKVGYDGTNAGTFSTTTSLDNPHPTGQGGYAYNTTLTAEADRYYRNIVEAEKQRWAAEVDQRNRQMAQIQQAQAAEKVQQQLTRQQQEQAYLSWGQSMTKTPQQRHDLAALKQKILQTPKTAGAEDTPFVSLERSVNQQMSALTELTGQPVSDAVQQGIRHKLLFERYGEAQEIALMGQTLKQSERKGLDRLFNTLDPSHEQKVRGDTDALYQRSLGKEPDRGDPTWTVFRNRLLREYYAGAGEPQQKAAQGTQGRQQGSSAIDFNRQVVVSGVNVSGGVVQPGAAQPGAAQPETPVGHFQRDLQRNAHNALESNRERLNQQQRHYQDPNPKSPYWQSLWKAKRTHDGLESRIHSLESQAVRSAEDLNNQSDLPSLKSPQEGRNSPRQKDLEALAAQKTAIRQELALLKGYKLQTEYEFPALSAVSGEKSNTRENNAAISGRIPQKFDEIRGSITDLEGQIQSDPKVALRLDKVVQKTLKGGGGDSPEVREWLASEQFWKNRSEERRVGKEC